MLGLQYLRRAFFVPLWLIVGIWGCSSLPKEYQIVRESQDLGLMRQFVAQYPESSYSAVLVTDICRLQNERYYQSTDIAALQQYLLYNSGCCDTTMILGRVTELVLVSEEERKGLDQMIAFMRKMGPPDRYPLVWQQLEQAYFKIAQKGYNTADMEQYIATFPGSEHKKEVDLYFEERDFLRVQRLGSIEDYRKFLAQYPHSRFQGEAKLQVRRLGVEALIAAGDIAGLEGLDPELHAEFSESIEKAIEGLSYRDCLEQVGRCWDYIERYPNGRYSYVVQNRIEKEEYRRVRLVDSLSEYRKFLTKYPNSAWGEQLAERINDLVYKGYGPDYQLAGLLKFISLYPESSHIPEAKRRRNKLTWELVLGAGDKSDLVEQIKLDPQPGYVARARARILAMEQQEFAKDGFLTTLILRNGALLHGQSTELLWSVFMADGKGDVRRESTLTSTAITIRVGSFLLELPFENLKHIELLADNKLSVELHSGRRLSGILHRGVNIKLDEAGQTSLVPLSEISLIRFKPLAYYMLFAEAAAAPAVRYMVSDAVGNSMEVTLPQFEWSGKCLEGGQLPLSFAGLASVEQESGSLSFRYTDGRVTRTSCLAGSFVAMTDYGKLSMDIDSLEGLKSSGQ